MRLVMGLAAGLTVLPVAALSQEWTFDASLYGWVPSLDATLDTALGQVEADGSGGDALEDLDMAFMGTFQARRGRWGLLLDVLYADLSDDKATPFDLAYRDVRLETRTAAVSGYALYRAYETPQLALDAGVGFRTFDVDLDAGFNSAGAAADRDVSAGDTWTVPLVAGRAILTLDEKWFATAYGDIGGTSGDTSTWQAFASIGYRFDERWSAQLGYRHMDIEREIGGIDADLGLSGPLVGATFHF
ncbi:hypothetical protein [Paracoccus marinaquae]|uniref:Outer membrane protein beta-barrel domain-containing protein n=1 Tax=Paracoccus marinaquae TaxID=2841926 RepID=A0ABS6AHM7_9RHOB|nr:hypothetical protein [Paracoccus marinaquae]MBU3029592.1 hypothetical protein [Paracoccus marinaquae]